MKQILALVIAMVMLLGLLAGCGGGAQTAAETASPETPESAAQEPAQSGETEQPAAAEAPAAEEPSAAAAEAPAAGEPAAVESVYPLTPELATLTFFTGFESEFQGVIDSMDDFAAIAEAESITNVHIDWVTTAGSAMVEKMNIMFATGECTDFISSATDFYAGGGTQAIEDGILMDISDLVETVMPNYNGLLTENPEIKLDVTENDGSFSYVRKLLEENFVSIGMAVRQDWLNALGLEAPDTYSELTDVLQAFYTEYQCSDTIFLDKEANFGSGFMSLGYGIPGYRLGDHTESQYYLENGKVQSSLLQDGYKDFLKMVAEWYAAGYISSDFITMDSRPGGDAQAAAINSGNTGVWKTSINVLGAVDSWVTDESLEIAPLDWIGIDESAVFPYADLGHSDLQNVSISTNCTDPELACRWLDFWFSDYGAQIWNWGMEGGCYELEDGEVKFLDSLYDNEWGISASSAVQAYSMASYSIPSIQAANRFSAFYSDLQTQAYDLWNGNSNDTAFLCYTDISPKYSEEYAAIINDICTYAETQILKYITGAEDIDATWDTYIAELEKMDIARAIEIMQLSYDEYLAK